MKKFDQNDMFSVNIKYQVLVAKSRHYNASRKIISIYSLLIVLLKIIKYKFRVLVLVLVIIDVYIHQNVILSLLYHLKTFLS